MILRFEKKENERVIGELKERERERVDILFALLRSDKPFYFYEFDISLLVFFSNLKRKRERERGDINFQDLKSDFAWGFRLTLLKKLINSEDFSNS